MQKVRELDTAQSRIHDTLQRINLTVDRSSAVDGIKYAPDCIHITLFHSQSQDCVFKDWRGPIEKKEDGQGSDTPNPKCAWPTAPEAAACSPRQCRSSREVEAYLLCCLLWHRSLPCKGASIQYMASYLHTQALALVLLTLRTSPFEPGPLACRAALATGDFEAAAEHVSKYLQLDKQFSDVTDELDSHQLQEQRAVWPCCPPMRTARLPAVHVSLACNQHTSVIAPC